MMNKYVISILLLSSTVINIYADDAPMYELPGGNVMPINNEDIRLVSETIDFYLYQEELGYDVEVNYNFYNEGKTQDIQLGFPTDLNRSHNYSDFVCTVNGKNVKVEKKPGKWTFLEKFDKYGEPNWCFPGSHDSNDEFHNGGNSFDVFTATFKNNDTTKIKNTYHAKYECNKDCEDIIFWYILETGRYWKGKIDEVRVRVNTDYYPEGFNYSINVHSFDNYEMVYKDIEPDFNPFFKIPTNRYYHMPKASSTLKQTGIFNYNIENIVDNNPATAWVEGEDGYGEGTTIDFGFTYYAGNSFSEAISDIEEIYVVNGYAKDATTFKNNSRVKDIEIELHEEVDKSKYFEIGEEDEFTNEYIIAKRKYNFTLEDTMEPQILKFDFPKKIFDAKVTIKSVYPGAKYKDTAISEFWFR